MWVLILLPHTAATCLPVQLRLACDGLLRTLGRLTWGGAVDHDFTAHPKIDPRTGEMLFFG